MDEVAARWLLPRWVVVLSTQSPGSRRWVGRRWVSVGRRAIVTSLLWPGLRWEELHSLASDPREQHVLMAEQVDDATNGLFSTLSSSAICTTASPGEYGPPSWEGVALPI